MNVAEELKLTYKFEWEENIDMAGEVQQEKIDVTLI
jgi:hypothetical protein